MTLSLANPFDLNCPRCGTAFWVNVWTIVDNAEHPDLVARILDGTLHDATCSHCGQTGSVPAPLLYHNRGAERVLLAVPPGMTEPEWREAGEGLLWLLVGAIPEHDRRAYLRELQAEAGLAGLAAVIRSERLADKQDEDGEPLPPLVVAIQAILAAQGPGELRRAVQGHPILLEPQTVAILRELAHEAFKQGEDEAGEGFSLAADILLEVRSLPQAEVLRAPVERPRVEPPGLVSEDPLEELAFALLRSHTGEMLAATVDQFPELLDPATDEALADWARQARAAGKPRIADGIDERRVAVSAMREDYEAQRPVLEAVQALLEAETHAELEAVLVEYDALYEDQADIVLGRLLDGADAAFALLVEERRALLRRIRSVLAAQPDDEPA